MIIQLRGTSGSGKTTVMREVMDRLGGTTAWKGIKKEGRKKPLYYRYNKQHPQIIVLGHYESACGGCDTIGSAAQVAELTDELVEKLRGPYVILQEGLLLSEDVKWTQLMPDVYPVFLTTPLDRCLKQIRSRRLEAGNEKPLNEANTTNRVAVIERARVKLLDLGIPAKRCTPEAAPALVCSLIERGLS